jgi:hypothetical protein
VATGSIGLITGGQLEGGQPYDIGVSFIDADQAEREAHVDGKMVTADDRRVMSSFSSHHKSLRNAAEGNRVLITRGFNPDGLNSKGQKVAGALCARYGTGVTH